MNDDPTPSPEPSAANHPRTLCVGIGSHHGDDQVGWVIVERIQRLRIPGVEVRQAASPAHLLDVLERCDRLMVFDACRGAGRSGSVHRWAWPCQAIDELRTPNSHGFGLAAVLRLAAETGQLPPQVVIWGVEAETTHLAEPLSDPIKEGLDELLCRIRDEFPDKACFAGHSAARPGTAKLASGAGWDAVSSS